MHKLLIAATAAALVITLPLFAEIQTVEEKKVKLVFAGEDSPSMFDVSDLEDGETREFYSESGKHIVISNNDGSLEITVDGEPLNIGSLNSLHRHIEIRHDADGHSEGESRIIFMNKDGQMNVGEDGEVVRWHGEDGSVVEILQEMIGGELGQGDGKVDVRFVHRDPAKRLLDSGALDDVDEETKERILEVLREGNLSVGHKVMLLEKLGEHEAHEDHDE